MNALGAYRNENRLTLEAVGKILGVTKATVFKYERRERLAADTVAEIERRLGIPKWKLRPDLWSPPEFDGRRKRSVDTSVRGEA